MVNDVARAFFEAKATRTNCIELLAEDKTDADVTEDMVGLLNMSLIGTRDAAQNWQEEVAKEMAKWGFKRGIYNPCLYHHERWGLKTLVHGDDFVSVGSREGMQRFRLHLEGRFEIKTTVVGPGGKDGPGEVQETGVLNRVLRVTPEGWEYEADQRHADLIIDELGLSEAMPTETPGENAKAWQEEGGAVVLELMQGTKFRSIAGRANYLAQGRPEFQGRPLGHYVCCKGGLSTDGEPHSGKLEEAKKNSPLP